jgi:hypothetical protein
VTFFRLDFQTNHPFLAKKFTFKTIRKTQREVAASAPSNKFNNRITTESRVDDDVAGPEWGTSRATYRRQLWRTGSLLWPAMIASFRIAGARCDEAERENIIDEKRFTVREDSTSGGNLSETYPLRGVEGPAGGPTVPGRLLETK